MRRKKKLVTSGEKMRSNSYLESSRTQPRTNNQGIFGYLDQFVVFIWLVSRYKPVFSEVVISSVMSTCCNHDRRRPLSIAGKGYIPACHIT